MDNMGPVCPYCIWPSWQRFTCFECCKRFWSDLHLGREMSYLFSYVIMLPWEFRSSRLPHRSEPFSQLLAWLRNFCCSCRGQSRANCIGPRWTIGLRCPLVWCKYAPSLVVSGQIIKAHSTVWWRQTTRYATCRNERASTMLRLAATSCFGNCGSDEDSWSRSLCVRVCVSVYIAGTLITYQRKRWTGHLRQKNSSHVLLPDKPAYHANLPRPRWHPRVLASFHVCRQWGGEFLEVVFFSSYQLPLNSPAELVFVKLCQRVHSLLSLQNSFFE